uniref:ATP-binding cassette sub-family G member 2-like n=1 Tax=Sinocyclocheilus anshuiensis TaxID=1608454 RepID=A0A671PH83_9TELE
MHIMTKGIVSLVCFPSIILCFLQDDVVMGTLTVRENLRFSAALRLPKSIRQREKDEKIERLIQELGLSKVADSRVGTQLIRGVSGGERKRTNIGMELIIDPPVLFLDEPTTGLDASTANSVLMLLKRCVYTKPAVRYPPPRDFPVDSASRSVSMKHSAAECGKSLFSSLKGIEDRLVEEYKNSSSYKQTKSELERIVQGQDYSTRPKSRTITYSTSFCHQFNWVLRRTFRNLMLNPQTSFAQIGVLIFLALVVGAIFFGVEKNSSGIQNRYENTFIQHEYISGYYRVSVYFLSKILSDILTLRTIPAIIFSCVAYFMIGLKASAEAFFIFLFSIVLVSYTATSMTLAISADQTVVAIANIFMTISFVFMMKGEGMEILKDISEFISKLDVFIKTRK